MPESPFPLQLTRQQFIDRATKRIEDLETVRETESIRSPFPERPTVVSKLQLNSKLAKLEAERDVLRAPLQMVDILVAERSALVRAIRGKVRGQSVQDGVIETGGRRTPCRW